MPYSFTKIEEDKTKTIGFVFLFLIVFYFITFWLIALIVKNAITTSTAMTAYVDGYTRSNFELLSLKDTIYILLFAGIVGYCHWQFTTSNLINKILKVLKAEPINLKDSYHKTYQNIIEEVSVATGGTKIEGVVLPTFALNAFALSDFKGRNVIGVTEGMLARLSRAQLEAVVGHEAAHIVSGDCLSATVTSSLFELYNGMLKGMQLMIRGGGVGRRRYSYGRSGGGGHVVIILIYLMLLVTRTLSQLLRMFISRQREYRADAVAVRLTRDPLSLAEALYGIRYHWRGAGLTAQELEAIFILSPKYSSLDEGEGVLSNLFSTHPPMENRVGVLMDMAHTDVNNIIAKLKKQDDRPRVSVPEVGQEEEYWMAKHEGKWQGPFELTRMATFGWLRPDTWIKRLGASDIQMAQDDHMLASYVAGSAQNGASLHCPKCHMALTKVQYEGIEVDKCPFCRGVLLLENDVKKIILRLEVGFSDKIKRLAGQMIKESDYVSKYTISRDPKTLLQCPKCNQSNIKMNRVFYTEVYRIEIDRCVTCGYIWFDADELELLQYLIEHSTAK